MQALSALFQEESGMKLPYCIAIAGFACILFAIAVPHLSALRAWLVFSTVLSLVYIITAIGLALKDGMYSKIAYGFDKDAIFHSVASSSFSPFFC